MLLKITLKGRCCLVSFIKYEKENRTDFSSKIRALSDIMQCSQAKESPKREAQINYYSLIIIYDSREISCAETLEEKRLYKHSCNLLMPADL